MSASSFRSPFAALVWKEWRESWWLLALMAAGPAALVVGVRVLRGPAATGFVGMQGGLCLMALVGLALSLGGGLFAGERMRGTETFQHERPVARGAIWTAKLFLPLLALASGVILGAIAALCLWSPEQLHAGKVFYLLIWLFLPLAAAALCSVLLDRPITAGASGGVLSVLALFGQGALIGHLMSYAGAPDKWFEPVLPCLFAVEAFGLLWLSRALYVRCGRD